MDPETIVVNHQALKGVHCLRTPPSPRRHLVHDPKIRNHFHHLFDPVYDIFPALPRELAPSARINNFSHAYQLAYVRNSKPIESFDQTWQPAFTSSPLQQQPAFPTTKTTKFGRPKKIGRSFLRTKPLSSDRINCLRCRAILWVAHLPMLSYPY